MYSVMLEIHFEGWTEEGHSDSFGDAWEYARILKKQNPGKRVKVMGPEGEWEVK